ncbi:MAG: BofC C-terminal domain-containing protein [Eubacteriales bacterium]
MLKHKISKNALLLFFAILICILSVASGMLMVSIREKISRENTDFNDDIMTGQDFGSLSLEVGQPIFNNSVMSHSVLYVVAEHNGAIGIFNGTHTELIELLDVDVSMLPESDRAYLINGIKIYTTAELLSVICDYTG